MVAPAPLVIAPVSAAIVWFQNMLTSVFGAVVPAYMQSDLYLFLLGFEGAVPEESGWGSGAGRSAAAEASVASHLRLLLGLAHDAGGPFAGNTWAATLEGMAARIFSAMNEVSQASSLPGTAPPAPSDATSTGVWPFLRHVVSDLPRAVSLWALAALALPGAAGLLILTLAGVGIGCRQAKASFVMRTTGIARFAGPGPLGVVRSGSSIIVHPRRLRVIRPGTLSGRSLPKIA